MFKSDIPTTRDARPSAVLGNGLVFAAGLFIGWKLLELLERRANLLEPRNSRTQTYRLALSRSELKALGFLAVRYTSAEVLLDSLEPCTPSAANALSFDFDSGEGPYEFEVTSTNATAVVEATENDGGEWGVIPNLSSPQIDAMMAHVIAE